MTEQSTRGAILQLFFVSGELSRAEVSRLSGLSKQTVSAVVADLEDQGLLEQVGLSVGHIGRRAVNFRLRPRAAFAMGADLGGSYLRAGLIDFSGRVVGEQKIKAPRRSLKDLAEALEQLRLTLAEGAGVPASAVTHLAMGVPGVADPMTGMVSMAPNLPYLQQERLDEYLSAELGMSVIIENDVNLAALGEQETLKCEDFVFIALGTGIGMALVLDGELRRGINGAAGEVGFLPLGLSDVTTEQVQAGVYESLVGGRAFEEDFHKRHGREVTMEEIFELAQASDPIGLEAVDRLAKNLALGVYAICCIVDPEEVVFGGGIGAREDLLLAVQHHLAQLMPKTPRFHVSTIGTRAGLVGAMSVALRELRTRALVGAETASDFPRLVSAVK